MSCKWVPFPELPHYEVSDAGEVRRVGAKKPLKPWVDNGYKRVGLWTNGKRRKEYVHALVCLTFHGPRNGRLVDHRDGDSFNNTKKNLRWATEQENSVNTGARTGTYKGVSWAEDRGKWRAHARGPDGKTKSLGSFQSEEQAALAYDEYVLVNYPDTARTNILCPVCGGICLPLIDTCSYWD